MKYWKAINEGLREELARDTDVLLMGEDIGRPGGTYLATKGLFSEFGPERVRDTPISEAVLIGAGVGAAMAGARPVVEIMYFDFIALAMDQIVNQAAKMRYMTAGGFHVPLTIRTMCGAGNNNGPQHSNNLETWFAHVPGLTVVMPASPRDAKGLLKSAIRSEDPVIVVESLGLWKTQGDVGGADDLEPIGRASIVRPGRDVTIVAAGRMVPTALEAAERLAERNVDAEVIDLRTIAPMDFDTVIGSVRRTRHAVVVHEAVRAFGFGAEIAAQITEQAFQELSAPVVRVAPPHTHVPVSPELEALRIPGAGDVVAAIDALRSPTAGVMDSSAG